MAKKYTPLKAWPTQEDISRIKDIRFKGQIYYSWSPIPNLKTLLNSDFINLRPTFWKAQQMFQLMLGLQDNY